MKQKILFIVSLLFALMMINSGMNKFLNYMPMPKNMSPDLMNFMGALIAMKWLLPLIAVIEIIGGVLFIFAKTRALGAIMLFPIVVGIVLTHTVIDTSGLGIALAMFAINVWIIIENRQKYMPMLTK